MFLAGHLVTGLLVGEIGVLLTGLPPSLVLFSIGAGSIFPDLDIFFHHRKTLHDNKLYFVAALLIMPFYLIFNIAIFAYAFLFLLGGGIHCITDIFGSGKEIRPWEANDDRAVYDHLKERFIEPRRLYYDGSLEAVSYTAAVSLLLTVIRPSNFILFLACIISSVTFRFFQIFVARRTEKFDRWSQLIKYQIFGGDPKNYD